jgi:hypothetical protein
MRTILGAALTLIAIGSFAAWATGGPLIFALGTVLSVIALLALIGLSGPSIQWKADDLVRADEHEDHQMSPGPAPPGADGGSFL